LISTDLQINRNENDYNELISPDQESTTTLNGNHEKEANANEKTQPIVKSQSDDLDFWLSGTTTNTTTSNQPQQQEPSDSDLKEKKSAKSKKSSKDSEEKSSKKSKKSKHLKISTENT